MSALPTASPEARIEGRPSLLPAAHAIHRPSTPAQDLEKVQSAPGRRRTPRGRSRPRACDRCPCGESAGRKTRSPAQSGPAARPGKVTDFGARVLDKARALPTVGEAGGPSNWSCRNRMRRLLTESGGRPLCLPRRGPLGKTTLNPAAAWRGGAQGTSQVSGHSGPANNARRRAGDDQSAPRGADAHSWARRPVSAVTLAAPRSSRARASPSRIWATIPVPLSARPV